MNLLEEAWMPVKCHNGERIRVRPAELARADLASFDAERADFNGALAQFAIGLLQTASPIDSSIEWRSLLKKAPDEENLTEWFMPYVSAFECDGDGARFMQDFDLRASDGDPVGVAALLIESPGEQTLKNNSDHFIKRGQVKGLCPHCAALALFTLQVNAPAGGAGHRTGLRGGGPLTTLLIADTSGGSNPTFSLWQSLWLNVRERHAFEAGGGDADKSALQFKFPWMASIASVQKADGQVSPVQLHPAHVFWAMPRRIRLDLEDVSSGTCDICASISSVLTHQYVTRNYGLNYKGPWSHPLSPYYESKEGMLPLHPQPDGLGYRHWLSWTMGMQNDKRKVDRAAAIGHGLDQERRTGIGLRLWAFGFDMDNMKARCWYDSTLPLYSLGDCTPQAQRDLRADVGNWLAGAELASSYLRGAVKDAWFTRDARGEFSFVDASFWSRTEADFYQLLRERTQAARDGVVLDAAALGERWLARLQVVVLRLFDSDLVGTGAIERQNPGRVAKAQQQLRFSLRGPKLRAALALHVEPRGESKSPKKAKGAKAAA